MIDLISFDSPKKEKIIQFSFVTQLKFPFPFIIREVTYDTHFSQNIHYHDFPQIWYCSNGNYIHSTETDVYNCSEGSLVIIPPGKYHSYEIPANQKATLICIDIAYNAFSNFCNGKYTNFVSWSSLGKIAKNDLPLKEFVTLSKTSAKYVKTVLKKLSSSLPHFEKNPPKNVITKLESIFSLPELALNAEQKKRADEIINSKLLPILKSLSFLNENFATKNISTKLATKSSLCRTNFFKYFREYLGITYSTYITMLRVNHAAYALVYTDYSISYISDMCGFASCSHMGIYYKKYKGILPKQDRKNSRLTRDSQPYIHISHSSFYDEKKQ